MRLIILGTGAANAKKCYHTCFLIQDEELLLLVDGGGGNTILRQLECTEVDYTQIHNVFVTHKHIDHILGIIWFIRTVIGGIKRGRYLGELFIFGHDEVIFILKWMMNNLINKRDVDNYSEHIKFIVVNNRDELIINGHKILFFDLLAKKEKQFGFRLELKNGNNITCCGDEPLASENYIYAESVTWLLCEAFCLFSEENVHKAYEKHHSTVMDAAMLAEKLNVCNLLLYHTEDNNLAKRKQLYTKEASEYFSGNIWVPNDLEIITD